MLFLESIKLQDGKIFNLEYHQQRVNDTFNTFFKNQTFLNLKSAINKITLPQRGFFKIRIIYGEIKLKIEIVPYQIRDIKSLSLVTANFLNYNFKFLEREELNKLKTQNTDDVIIIKNNKITDASFANLIFWDGENWFTPNTYLLNGVCRQRLLFEGKIKETEISLKNIFNFKKVGLINALLDLGDCTLDISSIIKN